MDYELEISTSTAFKRYRALARRRFRREDYAGTIEAVQEWYAWMDEHPDAAFPDDWADMTRMEQDAELRLRRRGTMLTF